MFYLLLATYGTVLLAELLGDKSFYTISSLTTRFRAVHVLGGISIAFAGKMLVAVMLGQAIAGLDPDYRIALRLLMREEGRHAQVLAGCVRALGGELVGHTWTHSLFVGARRLWGAKLKLMVLLSAEAIGASFYQLLSERLPAGPVREALAEIHRDEERHLEFHCQFFRAQVTDRGSRLRFQALFRTVGHSAAAGAFIIYSACCGTVVTSRCGDVASGLGKSKTRKSPGTTVQTMRWLNARLRATWNLLKSCINAIIAASTASACA